jgi:RimJ/RimL family protein N-acetyltransferase
MERLDSGAVTVQKPATTSGDAWHRAVPTLRSAAVTLREIKITDAQALLSHLGDPDLAPQSRPHTLADVQKFARVARERHRRGRLICLVIIPAGQKAPVGLIQLRPINASGSAAEFEVVIGRAFRDDGLFRAAVALMFQFAFGTLGVVRLEARPILAERRPPAAADDKAARKSRLRVVKR